MRTRIHSSKTIHVGSQCFCVLYVLQLRAGERLHDMLSTSIFDAPVTFFDANPVGRLLQRFSRDLDLIDSQLGGNLSSMVRALRGGCAHA